LEGKRQMILPIKNIVISHKKREVAKKEKKKKTQKTLSRILSPHTPKKPSPIKPKSSH
jgi:hypothetical protein